MWRAVILAALVVASHAFVPALSPGALKLRTQRAGVSMRAEPGQKILIEIPSHANTHVVAAVQEVIEEDASVQATASKSGSGTALLPCAMCRLVREVGSGRNLASHPNAVPVH